MINYENIHLSLHYQYHRHRGVPFGAVAVKPLASLRCRLRDMDTFLLGSCQTVTGSGPAKGTGTAVR